MFYRDVSCLSRQQIGEHIPLSGMCRTWWHHGGEVISNEGAPPSFWLVVIYQLKTHYKRYIYADTLQLQYTESKIEKLSYSQRNVVILSFSVQHRRRSPLILKLCRHSPHPVNCHDVEEMGQSILHINIHHPDSRYRLIIIGHGIRPGSTDSCSRSRWRSIFLYIHHCRSLCCHRLSPNGNN